MPKVLAAPAGGDVQIVLTSREIRDDDANGRLISVNGLRFTSIKDPAGDALAAGLLPTWHLKGEGRYVCYLDARTLVQGDYLCTIEAGVAFTSRTDSTEHRVPTRFVLRLLEGAA